MAVPRGPGCGADEQLRFAEHLEEGWPDPIEALKWYILASGLDGEGPGARGRTRLSRELSRGQVDAAEQRAQVASGP